MAGSWRRMTIIGLWGSFQVVDRHGFDAISRLEAKHLSVEVELGLEAAHDVLGLAEAVLLAWVGEIGHRKSLLPHGVGHHLRLIGRHHSVLEALEEDQRARQAADGMDWRPRHITLLRCRV